LVQGAKIILADEPIASLDPESARKVMELLCQLNDEGIMVITSLHQVQMVRRYFKRAIALRDGKVMFDGAVNDLNEQKLTSIYGSAVEELVTRGHGDFATTEDLLVKTKTETY
jgi:phosphonate transport system ATP-binding protein